LYVSIQALDAEILDLSGKNQSIREQLNAIKTQILKTLEEQSSIPDSILNKIK
jgi:hypothetical protein